MYAAIVAAGFAYRLAAYVRRGGGAGNGRARQARVSRAHTANRSVGRFVSPLSQE